MKKFKRFSWEEIALWLIFYFFTQNFEKVMEVYRSINSTPAYSVGGNQEILGNNVSLPWRAIAGGIIVALIASVPAIIVNYSLGPGSAFSASPFAGFTSSSILTQSLHWANMLFPIATFCTSLIGHWTLRWAVLTPAEIFGSSIRGWLGGI